MCADIKAGNFVGEDSFAFVSAGPKNSATVGRVGGRQEIVIFNWENIHIIAHEVKHALGWTHEHQRADRDRFVRINWANIQPDKRHNFDILVVQPDFSRDYDYESVMHYGPFDFSSNGLKTIEALPPNERFESVMGQRTHLTETDTLEIAGLYGDRGTEWCGLMPQPRSAAPSGCFFTCQRAANPTFGTWLMCGSCRGADLCP